MMQAVNELTERLSEPLPEGFILKLLLVRLTEVKICHLREKRLCCLRCINIAFFVVFSFLLDDRRVCKIVATVPTAASSNQRARVKTNAEDKPLLLICSCSVRAGQRQR